MELFQCGLELLGQGLIPVNIHAVILQVSQMTVVGRDILGFGGEEDDLLFQRVSDAQFIVDVWVSPCDICQDDLGVVDGLGDIPYDRLIVVDFIRA